MAKCFQQLSSTGRLVFCQGGVGFWRVSAGSAGVLMFPSMQMTRRVTPKAAGGSLLSGFPGHMHRHLYQRSGRISGQRNGVFKFIFFQKFRVLYLGIHRSLLGAAKALEERGMGCICFACVHVCVCLCVSLFVCVCVHVHGCACKGSHAPVNSALVSNIRVILCSLSVQSSVDHIGFVFLFCHLYLKVGRDSLLYLRGNPQIYKIQQMFVESAMKANVKVYACAPSQKDLAREQWIDSP